jgi:hypothetical protein
MLQLAFAGDDAQSRRINGNARMKGRTLTVERDRMPDRDISQVTFGKSTFGDGAEGRVEVAALTSRPGSRLPWGASPVDATLRPQPAGGRRGRRPLTSGVPGGRPPRAGKSVRGETRTKRTCLRPHPVVLARREVTNAAPPALSAQVEKFLALAFACCQVIRARWTSKWQPGDSQRWPRFTAADRALFAAPFHGLPLRRLHMLIRPDTVLRRHRDLIVRRHAAHSRPKRRAGPRPVRSTRLLVLRMARENLGGGSAAAPVGDLRRRPYDGARPDGTMLTPRRKNAVVHGL